MNGGKLCEQLAKPHEGRDITDTRGQADDGTFDSSPGGPRDQSSTHSII